MKTGKKRTRKSEREEEPKKGKKKNVKIDYDDDEIEEEEEDSGKKIAKAIRNAEVSERRAAGKKGTRAAKKRRLDSEGYDDTVLGMPVQQVLTETRYGLSSEAAPQRKLNVADLTAAAVLDESSGGQTATELRSRLQDIERKIAAEKIDESSTGPKALQKPDETVELERKDRLKKYGKQRHTLTKKWAKVVAANNEAEHVTFPLRNEDVREFTTSTTHGLSSRASSEPQNALEGRIRELLRSSGVDNKSVAKYERELRSSGIEAMDALIEENQEARDDDEEDEEMEEESVDGENPQQNKVEKQKPEWKKGDKKKKKKRQLTPEEEEERKMSMHLYYQQLKNMRKKKIKSKSFRKLERLRREELREMAREELLQINPELALSQEERQERDRVMERATQKHSRDSRHMIKLKRKGIAGQNPEVKKMLAERARVGRELTRKMDSVGLGVLGGGNDDEPEASQNFFTFDVPDIETGDDDSGRKGPRDDYDDTLAQENAKDQVRAKQDEQQAKVAEMINAIPETEAPTFAGATARIDKKSLGLSVSGNVTVSGIVGDAVSTNSAQKNVDSIDSENPWLAVPSEVSREKKVSKKKEAAADVEDDDGIDVDVAVAHQEDDDDGDGDDGNEDASDANEDDGDFDDNNPDLIQGDETQARLVAEAFAADDSDLEAEIDAEKMAEAIEDAGVDKEDPNQALPGWGQWAGEGVEESARARARREAREKAAAQARQAKIDETIAVRRDAALRHVVINEKLDKKILKYKLDQAPMGMSKEVYNRTVSIPVGSEWQPVTMHKELIQPAVRTIRGRVIEPMKAPQRVTPSGTTSFESKRRAKKDDSSSSKVPLTSISNSRKTRNK